MKIEGVNRVRGKFAHLKTTVHQEAAKANKRSGNELIRLARVLHPGDGETLAQIQGTANPDGTYLADFGDKAKVTEGDKGPRPFVNPALKVTRKKHRSSMKRAMNKAVKRAFGNG